MSSNIGIKIANGEFYPLLEENSSVKKRLVLTTVHDNQPSTQIDLYRSTASSMTDSQYIGSLVVENIQPKPKGDPSIEMTISSNADGEIVADAVDLDMGPNAEHHVLTISLKSLDESSRDVDNIPDFDLDSSEDSSSGSLYNKANKAGKEKTGRSFAWLLVLILLILLGLAAWYLFFGGKAVVDPLLSGEDAKTERIEPAKQEPVATEPAKPAVPAEPSKPPDPPPVITAPTQPPAPRVQDTSRTRPSAPVSSYNVPATIPREGVNYTIRWGDTLWDISEAFYRNPWLYPRIAQHNNIRNPNLIISGRTIRIPPKN